jgi:hypothetical protein
MVGRPPVGTAYGTYDEHVSGFEFFLLPNRGLACHAQGTRAVGTLHTQPGKILWGNQKAETHELD